MAMSGGPKPRVERRTSPRFATRVPAQYVLGSRREYQCTVVNVSASGLLLLGPESGAMGEMVVVSLSDPAWRVAGRIVRYVPGGFAVRFRSPWRWAEALAHRDLTLPAGK
jgi:hypothetical protein